MAALILSKPMPPETFAQSLRGLATGVAFLAAVLFTGAVFLLAMCWLLRLS